MTTSLHIREAQSHDTSAIASIYNEYVGNGTMDLDPKSAEYFNDFLESKSEREACCVAEFEGKVVGYSIIKQYSEREGYSLAAETSTYLNSNYLRMGFGSLIKNYMLKLCKNLGIKHIVAKIWTSNQSSISFHESLGYTIVGVQNRIGFVNGQWQDVTIMQYLVD